MATYTATEITKKAMGSGSFGIFAKTNGDLVTVWTVKVDGKFVGGFKTRKEAQEAAQTAKSVPA